MELKKPERKKPEPLPEGAKKISVLIFKGCTDEITDKKVVITEVAPHVYTYAYKLKKYGERVKIIFEIDGVYFQGSDSGAYVLEREDFTEICTKAYKLARQNVADGAASGMAYFIEVQKRIDAATPTDTPQIPTESTETVNVSAEGEKEAETKEMPQIFNCEWQTVEHFKAIPNIAKLAKAGIIINGVVWHTEYLDKAHKVLARVDNLGWHDDGKGFGGFQGSGVFGKTAIFKSWDNAVIATIDALTDYLRKKGTEPPQSPETPQTVDCVTDTPKPREMARKRQNRGIGNTRHSRLGANGYAMLDNASATLAAISVPRECSTEDAAYW